MKKRISVALDEPDLGFVKEYGAKHDITLSRVIEIALWRLKKNPAAPLFGEKWCGRLKVRKRPGDPRFEYLKRKYGL